MKAALITRYGSPDVIRIAEVARPSLEPGEILVRVHAASVNRTDSGEPAPFILLRLVFGLWRPRRSIFGMDVAGVVEQVGAGVTRFSVGDRTAAVQARHLDLVPSLGADHVVDCASGEFARLGRRFEIVYDSVGKMTIRQWRRLLKPNGIFATTDVGPGCQNLLAWLGALIVRSKRVRIPLPRRSSVPQFLADLRDRMEAGRYHAIIDRSYRLEQIADAYRYVLTGQKAGIVVFLVASV